MYPVQTQKVFTLFLSMKTVIKYLIIKKSVSVSSHKASPISYIAYIIAYEQSS